MTTLLTEDDLDIGPDLRRRLGLLTEEEIAAVFRKDIGTVRNWRSQRKGPPFTKMGATVLYREAALDQWLAEREKETE